MDNAIITAWGTFLAGSAAFGAVFGTYYTMTKQLKKNRRAEWVNTFRVEAAHIIVLSQFLSKSSSDKDRFDFSLKSTSILLLLDTSQSDHSILNDRLAAFTNVILVEQNSSDHFIQYYNREIEIIISLFRKIISDSEKSI